MPSCNGLFGLVKNWLGDALKLFLTIKAMIVLSDLISIKFGVICV